MQFLPTSTSGSVSALGGVMGAVSSAASGVVSETNAFLESLNKELADAGVKPVVDPVLESLRPQGFRTIQRDVSSKISEEDANAIIANLRKKGVKDPALAGVEDLLASGQSLSLGTIAGALRQNGRKTGELTDDEIQGLNGILAKMQFSAEETDELITMMQNGQGFAALRAINERLASSGGNFSLDASELATLARGLDVSENAMQKIAALMGENENIEGKDLESLLGPAAEELAADRAEKEKIAAELKDAIETALRDKKIREATEPVTDMRGSKQSERAETRMRDDLTHKGTRELALEEEERLQDEEAFAEQQAKREHNAREHTAMTDSQRTVAVKGTGEGASSAQNAAKNSEGFATLTSRMDVASGMTAPAQTSSAAPQQPATTAYNRQEVFSQVEQGLLKQLSDGSRQMTLRLDPGELGQLSLLVTVKGGEVRALIRTDNAETTALLSEQMSQLRASLEEQGLKVAQLDVETQLPQDTTQDNFSGMEHYQQEQEMREQARFMRLAKLRREAGENLAQDVQSKSEEEEISPSGLHIIA
ncbi:MAG: hypothetical protein DELT_00894 [Desulfovibrio sp.]